MAFSNHTNGSSVMPKLFHMYVEQKKTLRFNNYSNPALEMQEEIMASFYILIIVGFFGFLLFVMMLSNIVSSKPENYIDYLYSGKFNPQRSKMELSEKESKDTFVIINGAALMDLQKQDIKYITGLEALSTDAVLRNGVRDTDNFFPLQSLKMCRLTMVNLPWAAAVLGSRHTYACCLQDSDLMISHLEAPELLPDGCDITGTTRATTHSVSSAASNSCIPLEANMQRFANPLLRHIIPRGCFDDASKTQCLQYLRTLRALQRNGFNTIFLGETDIPESLITGEKTAEEASLRWPIWTLVHAGSSQGWVPWRYKLLLRNELPTQKQNSVFQELCDSLTMSYGKCIIVTRDKRQLTSVGAKNSKEQEMGLLPSVPPVIYMSSIKCCPETARANGHELLAVPPSYTYLYPMDVAWSSLKWFIINNRKDFALRSVENTHSYRCILFNDLIIKGIEKMTPNKWKIAINKVKKWENYYLDSFS